MGLDVPELDDRTYEQLIEDAVKQLPVRAPEWTDHNAHDPGITILELLAWLSESYGYELDQITDDHRRKYLELAGVEPRPPQSATAALSIDIPDRAVDPLKSGSVDPTPDSAADPNGEATNSGGEATNLDDEADADGWIVETGSQVVAETNDRTQVAFETVADVPLTRAEVAAVVSEHGRGRTDHTSDNATDGQSFPAFGRDARVGNALYLGFDRDPFEPTGALKLLFEFHGRELPVPSRRQERSDHSDGDDTTTFDPSLRVRWEHCVDPDGWYHDDAWEPVPVEYDGTNQFYAGGWVGLRPPETWRGGAEATTILGHNGELFWLRCRLDRREQPTAASVPAVGGPDSGADSESILLEPCSSAPDQSEATSRRGGGVRYEIPPRFDAIRTNAVPVRHRKRGTGVTLERIERTGPVPGFEPTETTAEANQRFAFPEGPIVDVELTVGGVSWERVKDFDASGPDDRHYVLDAAAGAVQFGDGRRGTIPPVGRAVVATSVVYGGGPAGNVGADADWRLLAEAYRELDASPIAPPTGGRDAEPIAEALDRARDQQDVPHRAVTASDYRDLALRTPKVRVERANAIAGRCAGTPDRGPNHVTVVVVPETLSYRRRATPTQGFLETVERHLCARSLLTDRVSVVAPTYVGVRIAAEISVSDGYAPGRVRRTAESELTSFLDPWEGYDGDGWPFDRPVHTSELYELLESIAGVEDAFEASVAVGDGPDLATDGTTLPYPESVSVTVRGEPEQCGRGV